jgi:hypothetical protein
MQRRHDNRSDEDIEMHTPVQHNVGGGSVLASLMKLEAHRTTNETKKKNRKVRHFMKVLRFIYTR